MIGLISLLIVGALFFLSGWFAGRSYELKRSIEDGVRIADTNFRSGYELGQKWRNTDER